MGNTSEDEKKTPEAVKDTKHNEHPEHGEFHFDWKIIALIAVALVLVLVLGLNSSTIRRLRGQLAESQRVADTLRLGNDEKTEKIAELEERDGEQDKELAAMSKSLTTKTDELTALQEKEAARYIPNMYPLRGASSLLQQDIEIPDEEEPDEEEPDDEITEENPEEQIRLAIPPDAPSAVFMTAAESRAIATAEGTVTKVTGDADKGYQIVLDHGNGYTTVYEGFGLALVGENDTVGRGSALLYFVDDTSIFTYWIRYGEVWMDPMESIDING